MRQRFVTSFIANTEADRAIVIYRQPNGLWTGLPAGATESNASSAGALMQAILEDLSSGHYGESAS
jgi:hypothetical protein